MVGYISNVYNLKHRIMIYLNLKGINITLDKQINDMNILDFGRSISMINIDTPISIEFDNNYGQKKDRWWTCQSEHLTVWCLYQQQQDCLCLNMNQIIVQELCIITLGVQKHYFGY